MIFSGYVVNFLTGFLSSGIVGILKLLNKKEDTKREIKILEMQLEQQRLGYAQRLEEIKTSGEVDVAKESYSFMNFKSGIKLIDALSCSVRPVLAYGAFYIILFHVDMETKKELATLIISFWFGGRVFGKMK